MIEINNNVCGFPYYNTPCICLCNMHIITYSCSCRPMFVCIRVYVHASMHNYVQCTCIMYIHVYLYIWGVPSGESRGVQIRPWPPSKLAMEFGPPSGAERVMIALWIGRNVRVLAPPYRRRLRIWLPLRKKYHIKTWKRSMTKKRSSEILGDKRHVLWKSFKNFVKNLGPRFWSSGSASV